LSSPIFHVPAAPTTSFAEVLERLLWRLCTEHPHHSLLQASMKKDQCVIYWHSIDIL
jgi:hypothetical protein